MNVKKIIAAIALFAVAGAAAFFLKDLIDRANPEYAIPRITVTADTTEIEAVISGFSWKFYFGDTVIKPDKTIYDGLAVPPTALLGGENLKVSFSQPATELKIRRSASYSYSFEETDDMTAPFEPGGYIYEVYARFDRGAVLYYFYVVVE